MDIEAKEDEITTHMILESIASEQSEYPPTKRRRVIQECEILQPCVEMNSHELPERCQVLTNFFGEIGDMGENESKYLGEKIHYYLENANYELDLPRQTCDHCNCSGSPGFFVLHRVIGAFWKNFTGEVKLFCLDCAKKNEYMGDFCALCVKSIRRICSCHFQAARDFSRKKGSKSIPAIMSFEAFQRRIYHQVENQPRQMSEA